MKKASSLLRRDRTIRFALFGASLGAMLIVALLLVINFFALFVPQVSHSPTTLDELYGVLMTTLIVVAVTSFICGVIGFSTARIPMRIMAYRILGAGIIGVSLGFGAWVTYKFSIGDMYWFGVAMEYAVSICGIATGALAIERSRGVVIENL